MPQQMAPVFMFRLYQVVVDPQLYDLSDEDKARQVQGKVPRPTELAQDSRSPLITPGQLADLLNELQDRGACGPMHVLGTSADLGQLVLLGELTKMVVLDLGGDILLPGPGTVARRN